MLKISKTKARKMFNEAQTILIVPHKVSPKNVWSIGLELNKNEVSNSIHNQTYETQGFDWWVDHFTFCNCCSESGYYCAYYIKEEND